MEDWKNSFATPVAAAVSPQPQYQMQQFNRPPPFVPSPTVNPYQTITSYQNPLPPSPQHVPNLDIPINYSIGSTQIPRKRKHLYEGDDTQSEQKVCINCHNFEKQCDDLIKKMTLCKKSIDELDASNNLLLLEAVRLKALVKLKTPSSLPEIPKLQSVAMQVVTMPQQSVQQIPTQLFSVQPPLSVTPQPNLPVPQFSAPQMSNVQVSQPVIIPQQQQQQQMQTSQPQLSQQMGGYRMPSQQLSGHLTQQQITGLLQQSQQPGQVGVVSAQQVAGNLLTTQQVQLQPSQSTQQYITSQQSPQHVPTSHINTPQYISQPSPNQQIPTSHIATQYINSASWMTSGQEQQDIFIPPPSQH